MKRLGPLEEECCNITVKVNANNNLNSFPRGELHPETTDCWSELPFPSPEDLPNPGIKPGSPALQADSLLPESIIFTEFRAYPNSRNNLP